MSRRLPAAILVLSFLRQPGASLVAIATALAGLPVYFFFKWWARRTP